MHSMDNYYVSKLLPLMAEAGVAAIANPLINIVIQGRHDTYPKRRGMTRIPRCAHTGSLRLRARLRDGSLVLARIRRHARGAPYGGPCRHMTSRDAMAFCFDAVTTNPAAIMGLEGYGLEPGCTADFVLLQARDPIDAIRLKATRLAVVRRGRVIAETPARIPRCSWKAGQRHSTRPSRPSSGRSTGTVRVS
jgi:cytosine deaminase